MISALVQVCVCVCKEAVKADFCAEQTKTMDHTSQLLVCGI